MFYKKANLMKVARARGYMSTRALADALVPAFDVTSKSIQNKLTYGSLTMAECEVIGSLLEMNMKEYYDVFMNGLFVVDQNGNYVCHIEEPYRHLHREKMAQPLVSEKQINAGKLNLPKKSTTAKEVLEQLKDY